MQPISGCPLTAASPCQAEGTRVLDDGEWETLVAHGDGIQQKRRQCLQSLSVFSATGRKGGISHASYMRQQSSQRYERFCNGPGSVASDSSHRMSGEVALELSPPTGICADAAMSGQHCHPSSRSPPPAINSDSQRPYKVPKQGIVRASSMAQSITRFFQRARPVFESHSTDSAPVKTAAAQSCSTKASKKRRLGYSASVQECESTTPSSHGLVAAGRHSNATTRIPGMFKVKRMLEGQADTDKHWKHVNRPTLATTVFAGRPPNILLPVNDEEENYTISSTMQTAFDMANASKREERHAQTMHTVLSPTCSDGSIPCGMAPNVNSPTASEHLPDPWTHAVNEENDRMSLQEPDFCTPAQSSAAGRPQDKFAAGSVHTPPELTVSAVLECPGAPVKKRGDTEAFEVVSRLSSLSVDSVDMGDSPFAPGAPAWSPRADVRRALRFD